MAKKFEKSKNKKNFSNKKQNQQHTKKLKQQLKEVPATGLIEGVFVYTGPITIANFAKEIGKTIPEILRYFFNQGLMLNQNRVLSEEQIAELAIEYGFDFRRENALTKENIFEQLENTTDNPADLKRRPPVVTVMGHVDHGKTTLLDTIRHTNVVSKEQGGITQAIGAYQIHPNHPEKTITFIDTPGHEAFTEMRGRGANVTDIVVLVVAADDGIMPQTEEAIDHAKQAQVPIIVFINKMDTAGANPQKIKSELMKYGIVSEEFGGEVPFIEGSARQNQGLKELVETILLMAEVHDLKANPNKLASGVVLEAHLDKNKGPVATILVQQGSLKVKDVMISGLTFGTIKSLENENNQRVATAKPSQPVVITGLNEVPSAGDKFITINNEKMARQIANAQALKKQQESWVSKQVLTLDVLKNQLQENEAKLVNIIVKANTQGSVEALRHTLEKITIDGVKINLIRAAVGAISNADVILANASHAMIYGFNVRPTAPVRKKAEEDRVEIRLFEIIYKLIEDLEAVAKGQLEPDNVEVVIGQAEIRALFRHSAIGTIGGFHVLEGVIPNRARIRVLRNGVVVYDGEIASLKHEKNEIKEAKRDSEGGLTIKNFNDLKEGDIVEAYKIDVRENSTNVTPV